MEVCFISLANLGDLRYRIPETITLLLLTNLFYLVSVYRVLKSKRDARCKSVSRLTLLLGAAAVVFRLTVWPLCPALSDDVFRYRWEGMLQSHGGNPYQSRPMDPEWEHLRDETYDRIPVKDNKAGYGPLLELIERWTYPVAATITDAPMRQAFWFKLPSALFDLGIIAGLWWLLRLRGLPPERVLIYAWSPLPVVEFWATGHNDSIAVFLVVAALVAAASRRWAGSFALLTLAACAKIWPLVLFPIFVGWRGWRPDRWWQPVAAVPVTAALIWPYWSNVEENVRFMTGFASGWRNNDSLYGAILWLMGDQYAAKDAVFFLIAATAVVVTLLRWPLERAALATITVMLLVSANCHPWYLTWALPLLAFVPVPALLLWTAIIPLAYRVVIDWVLLDEWHGTTPWRWLVYVPVFGMMLGSVVVRILRWNRTVR